MGLPTSMIHCPDRRLSIGSDLACRKGKLGQKGLLHAHPKPPPSPLPTCFVYVELQGSLHQCSPELLEDT